MQANFVWADIFRHQDAQGNISFSDTPSKSSTRVEPIVKTYRYKHKVKRVYDGDTIILENGDRVRLLGINTPEIESRYRQGEDGGLTAKKWLQTQLKEGVVFLEYDQLKHDKYKRSLAHLFLENGEHLNKSMVNLGLATLSIIPPNTRYSDVLKKAEIEAQKKALGIWSMQAYQPLPISKLTKDTPSSWHRFTATPVKITQSRKYIRLVLNDKVDVRIPKENKALFPELETYLGKALEIRGWASRSKSHYSILIRHPSALIFL